MSKVAAKHWRTLALMYEQRSGKLVWGDGTMKPLSLVSLSPWNHAMKLLYCNGPYTTLGWPALATNHEAWGCRATACALLAAIEEDESKK